MSEGMEELDRLRASLEAMAAENAELRAKSLQPPEPPTPEESQTPVSEEAQSDAPTATELQRIILQMAETQKRMRSEKTALEAQVETLRAETLQAATLKSELDRYQSEVATLRHKLAEAEGGEMRAIERARQAEASMAGVEEASRLKEQLEHAARLYADLQKELEEARDEAFALSLEVADLRSRLGREQTSGAGAPGLEILVGFDGERCLIDLRASWDEHRTLAFVSGIEVVKLPGKHISLVRVASSDVAEAYERVSQL